MEREDFIEAVGETPLNWDDCAVCGGRGLKPIMHCQLYTCEVCHGMPVDYVDCDNPNCAFNAPAEIELQALLIIKLRAQIGSQCGTLDTAVATLRTFADS